MASVAASRGDRAWRPARPGAQRLGPAAGRRSGRRLRLVVDDAPAGGTRHGVRAAGSTRRRRLPTSRRQRQPTSPRRRRRCPRPPRSSSSSTSSISWLPRATSPRANTRPAARRCSTNSELVGCGAKRAAASAGCGSHVRCRRPEGRVPGAPSLDRERDRHARGQLGLARRDRNVGGHRLGTHHRARRRREGAGLLDRDDRAELDARRRRRSACASASASATAASRASPSTCVGVGEIELRAVDAVGAGARPGHRGRRRAGRSRARARVTWFDTW